ncbi:hypothetical protein OAX11_05150, partial [Flavobacteriaceae bacterium]|nr:hypothetical protein [Flavobacteriaceae bacterium]
SLFIIACQQDDIQMIEEANLKENGTNPYLKQGKIDSFGELSRYITKQKNTVARTSAENANQFTVLENQDVLQYNVNGIKTYTLQIVKDEQPENSFSNLVVKFEPNNEPKAFIFDYFPTQEYLTEVQINPQTTFKGDYKATQINYDNSLNSYLTRNSEICHTVSTNMCDWNPDPDGGPNPHVAGNYCSDTYWVRSLVCEDIGTYIANEETESLGGSGVGGASNNNDDDTNSNPFPNNSTDNDTDNNQNGFDENGEVINTTPTKPKTNPVNSNIERLKALTDNTKIKAKIAELLPKVTTNNKEDGAQYDQTGTTPLTFNEVLPDSTYYTDTHFPALRSNTKVTVHLHTDDVSINGQTHELIPVFSDGDIDGFIADSADLNDNEYTSILASEAGVLALRITDLTRVIQANQKLNNSDNNVEKFYDRYKTEVINEAYNDTPAQAIKRLLSFLNNMKFDDDDENISGIGISLYQAIIVNDVITDWQKVTN